MRFSIQQIKYDFLYAIREFDSDGGKWSVMASDRPAAETLSQAGYRLDDYIFVGKPAGTDRAASMIRDHFIDRFGVGLFDPKTPQTGECNWVILFRSRSSLPHQPNMLDDCARA